MRNQLLLFFFSLTVFSVSAQYAAKKETLKIDGLNAPVEIIIDHWGIPHIYAQNEHDLFFAQGFNAARDRLFQFEIWRRQATGTVAEILGERELKRDIGTRLFQFRGDIRAEMNHYHDRGELIITAYVEGVNQYIELTRKNPDLLPIEFRLLGIKPHKWTPEVVISRHQGLLGNINEELRIGRQVVLMGAEKTKTLNWFHPNDPLLALDSKIDGQLLMDDILEVYNAYRRPVRFQPGDLVADARNDWKSYRNLAMIEEQEWQWIEREEKSFWGSNNWVVSGDHTQSGYPMMANDPHRTQSTPSLRYMSHLVAPGWDVIGGGEPEIPGISIGHNEYGAWGLTVFRTDAEDLYVYDLNPENQDQYLYKGDWENMRIIEDEIPVKNQKPVKVGHRYTRHGPVVHIDKKNNKAYAVRCGWLEIGGSPYLASLRMNQSKNFEEFKEACNYSNIPGENMIWADKAGNIGWQAVGIAPIRRNFSGLVPVPGDGSYEWDGYLPIIAKPNVYNPSSGIFLTANENVTPHNYPYKDALGFSWSDPFRGDRVAEVLHSGKKQTLMSMAALQTDYYSIPARELIPLLKELDIQDEKTARAKDLLLNWKEFELTKNSVEAGIYVAWERALKENMENLVAPEAAKKYYSSQLKNVIEWLVLPDGKFGPDPVKGRDEFVIQGLKEAVDALTKQLGQDMDKWQYGQVKYKHIYLKHPLSNAVKPKLREKLDVGPASRGGNGYTVGSTGNRNNQSSGGSFRIIVDCVDWDQTLGTNNPGQSGNPDDPFYKNLFDIWAEDKFFPVFYSRAKVEEVSAKVFLLQPGD